MITHGFLPPYVLAHLADHDDEVGDSTRHTLELDERRRGDRPTTSTPSPSAVPPTAPATATAAPNRTIHDARHRERLPGPTVRTEGGAATGDDDADQVYDRLGVTFDFYSTVYGRDSIDGVGLPLVASVHYGTRYDNAFWNGEQMAYGDGDQKIFTTFTEPVGITAHELTHGVVQYSGGLDYLDQSGALNESVCDVFGSLVKQFHLGQTAEQADWLIGAGMFARGVHGDALRSLKAPGTAYDDPALGKDPQPATMSGYVHTNEDNGGVHINSGIPNHAFYLVATAIGGNAWKKPGKIWYETLTGGQLSTDADFSTFASLTLATADKLYGADGPDSDAVRAAWAKVGVEIR